MKYSRKFFLARLTKIVLIAADPERRYGESRFQRCAPQVLMVWTDGNMRAHDRHGIPVAVTILNLSTPDGIRIVDCPYLRKITENTEIICFLLYA